jgi:hypothetical protein
MYVRKPEILLLLDSELELHRQVHSLQHRMVQLMFGVYPHIFMLFILGVYVVISTTSTTSLREHYGEQQQS